MIQILYRVLRGGSWYDRPAYAHASNRFGNVPSERDGVFGLRCARKGAK